MIDYIRANLEHEDGCEAGKSFVAGPGYEDFCSVAPIPGPYPCTCPRAEAERWLRGREAFVEAFGVWRADGLSGFSAEHDVLYDAMMTAYARLEGE